MNLICFTSLFAAVSGQPQLKLTEMLISIGTAVAASVLTIYFRQWWDTRKELRRSATLGIKAVDRKKIDEIVKYHVDTNSASESSDRLKEDLRCEIGKTHNPDVIVLSGPSDVGKMQMLYKAYCDIKNDETWKDSLRKLKAFEVNTAPEWQKVCDNVIQFLRLSHCCEGKRSNVVFVFDFDQALSGVAAMDIIYKVRALRAQIDTEGQLIFVVKCICNAQLPGKSDDGIWFINTLTADKAQSFLAEYKDRIKKHNVTSLPSIGAIDPDKEINYRQCVEMSGGHIGRLISSFAMDRDSLKRNLIDTVEASCNARILAWQRRAKGSVNNVEPFLAMLHIVALFMRALEDDETIDLRALISTLAPQNDDESDGYSFAVLKNVLRGAFCLEGVDFSTVRSADFKSRDDTLWSTYVALRGQVGVHDFVDELCAMLRLLAGTPEFAGYLPRLLAAQFDMSIEYRLLLLIDSPDPAKATYDVLKGGFLGFLGKIPALDLKATFVLIARKMSGRLWQQIGVARNAYIKAACDLLLKEVTTVAKSARSAVFVELGPLYVACGQSPLDWWKDWHLGGEREEDVDSAVLGVVYILVAVCLREKEPANGKSVARLVCGLIEEFKRYSDSALAPVADKVIGLADIQYRFKLPTGDYDQALRNKFLKDFRELVVSLRDGLYEDPRVRVLILTMLAECSYESSLIQTNEDRKKFKELVDIYESYMANERCWPKLFTERAQVLLSAYKGFHEPQTAGRFFLLNADEGNRDRRDDSSTCKWSEFGSPEHLRSTLWLGINACKSDAAMGAGDVKARLHDFQTMAFKTAQWLSLPYRSKCFKYLSRGFWWMDDSDKTEYMSHFAAFIGKLESCMSPGVDVPELESDIADMYSDLGETLPNIVYGALQEGIQVKSFLLDKRYPLLEKSYAVRSAWLMAVSHIPGEYTDSRMIRRVASVLFGDGVFAKKPPKDDTKAWFYSLVLENHGAMLKDRVSIIALALFLEKIVSPVDLVDFLMTMESRSEIAYTDREAETYSFVLAQNLNDYGALNQEQKAFLESAIRNPKGHVGDLNIRLCLAVESKHVDLAISSTEDLLACLAESANQTWWDESIGIVLKKVIDAKVLPSSVLSKMADLVMASNKSLISQSLSQRTSYGELIERLIHKDLLRAADLNDEIAKATSGVFDFFPHIMFSGAYAECAIATDSHAMFFSYAYNEETIHPCCKSLEIIRKELLKEEDANEVVPVLVLRDGLKDIDRDTLLKSISYSKIEVLSEDEVLTRIAEFAKRAVAVGQAKFRQDLTTKNEDDVLDDFNEAIVQKVVKGDTPIRPQFEYGENETGISLLRGDKSVFAVRYRNDEVLELLTEYRGNYNKAAEFWLSQT